MVGSLVDVCGFCRLFGAGPISQVNVSPAYERRKALHMQATFWSCCRIFAQHGPQHRALGLHQFVDDVEVVAVRCDDIPRLAPQTMPYVRKSADWRKNSCRSAETHHALRLKQDHFVGAGHEQPITRELAEYLEQRMAMLPPGCEWLNPSSGSATGHVHTIREAFRRSAERAGLDPDQITPHTLRHTAVTHLVQAGADLPTVQRISGHKTLSMVARYAHQSGSHIEAAMNHLEGRVSVAQSERCVR